MVFLPFIFPHGPRLNMEAYIKCLKEYRPGLRGWLPEDPTFDNITLYPVPGTKEGETSVSREKISATTSSPTFGRLTLHISVLLIILSADQLSGRSIKLRATPKKN